MLVGASRLLPNAKHSLNDEASTRAAGECIQVAVRVRPLTAQERLKGCSECLQAVPEQRLIRAAPDKAFHFDYAYGPMTTQQDVYGQSVRLIVGSFLAGYNATVLAYGQTGSGKTHTMGTSYGAATASSSSSLSLSSSNSGTEEMAVIARAMDDIFANVHIAGNEGPVDPEGAFVELYASFLEIYNEHVIDLLVVPSISKAAPYSSSSYCTASNINANILTIREHSDGSIYVAGLTEEGIRSRGDIDQLIQKGSLARTTKSTELNLTSSRSHAVLTLLLKRSLQDKVVVSKLHFVDLAGSERLKRTNVAGERVRESISINSGLLALGNVISALASKNAPNNNAQQHVPYRDSKLTRLLQDSLGGNSRTLMIACVSASSEDLVESVNTLRYAHRARTIRNQSRVNEHANGDAFELMQLRKQVAALRQELLDLRTGRHSNFSDNSPQDLEMAVDWRRRCEQLEREKTALQQELDALRALSTTSASSASKRPFLRSSRVLVASAVTNTGVPSTVRLPPHNYSPKSPIKRLSVSLEDNQMPGSPSVAHWTQQVRVFVADAKRRLAARLTAVRSLDDVATPDDAGQDEGTTDEVDLVTQRVQELLAPVKEDLAFKSDLIGKIEAGQREFAALRQRYDERLHLATVQLVQLRRERDDALRQLPNTNANANTNTNANQHHPTPSHASNAHSQSVLLRQKYEERIKQLTRDNARLQEQVDAATKPRQPPADPNAMRALRAEVRALKEERGRLQELLERKDGSLRSASLASATDGQEWRARERRAQEQATKWRKAYEFERTLLQRRVEQFLQAKAKIRQLLHAMRRKHVNLQSPSVNVNLQSPGWRALLSTNPPASTSSISYASTTSNWNQAGNPQGIDLDLDARGATTSNGSSKPSSPLVDRITGGRRVTFAEPLVTDSDQHHQQQHGDRGMGGSNDESVFKDGHGNRGTNLLARLANAANLATLHHRLQQHPRAIATADPDDDDDANDKVRLTEGNVTTTTMMMDVD